MNFFLLLTAVMIGISEPSSANPYFRPLDLAHLHPIVGAMISPTNLKESEVASLLPIWTHSPKDGCLFPSVVCEDWTPLALGAAMNAGDITFDVAPLFNVLPWMQRGILSLVPEQWYSTRALLTPTTPDDAPVTFSAGPVWEYQQRTNKGYYKTFVGLALHF